jgi:hypothetical protein
MPDVCLIACIASHGEVYLDDSAMADGEMTCHSAEI